MAETLADIIRIMEQVAPSHLAEDWDNSGLQVGKKDWPVKTIWVSLDPGPDVVAHACKNNADLLITHHPLIFKPLKSVDFSTPTGSVVHMASQHHLAIFSAHTNLDSATGGVNDVLASEIGLKNTKVLQKAEEPEICKLVIYVPAEYEQKVSDALFETKAGRIGEYSCCSFRNKGKGTFRPNDLAKPFIGKPGEISLTDEIRMEVVVSRNDLINVIEHVREKHPYETMAYDVYPLRSDLPDFQNLAGLGRIGELDKEMSLTSFALKIKKQLKLNSLKISGKPDMPVHKAAVCTGSGSGLMKAFFLSGAQVYISGDLRYHDAREAEAAGLGLIDIGHFASEHLIVEPLAEQLRKILSETGADVKVEAYLLENDPFLIV
ncbi:Nif3-like dinuclear metal center hexameric protein [Desulfonema magnum]|uniref:GTP cyclohydrolase 1 type 2 homolog n=1 Tax=Desulfonema magnum TaxID=45655 RepID=A0A975GLQ6_9BACT|nr:Nif3-like dinuclear metal center hexameric protein [Desulfonema magnum]QTA85063.1 Dinuclear metal center protein, YbgI/SA1388 family [Desulfonema magnum]